MPHAKVGKKTTLWLGSDDDELEDGHQAGMQGYGFDVNSEDNMVAINGTTEGGDEVVVFIMRDLFPKIRAVMERIDGRFGVVSATEDRPEVRGDETLFDALDKLRLDAGQPSLREITTATGDVASHSTIHNIFKYRKVPPKWSPVLASVVRSLGGDEAEFLHMWQAALIAERGSR